MTDPGHFSSVKVIHMEFMTTRMIKKNGMNSTLWPRILAEPPPSQLPWFHPPGPWCAPLGRAVVYEGPHSSPKKRMPVRSSVLPLLANVGWNSSCIGKTAHLCILCSCYQCRRTENGGHRCHWTVTDMNVTINADLENELILLYTVQQRTGCFYSSNFETTGL